MTAMEPSHVVSGDASTERDNLERAIAALDSQRDSLGDDVVEAALGPMQRRLAELRTVVATPAQQRKQVTVLLADVAGYTALSAAMDAEDVGDLMDALWRRIDAVIVDHGGMIDKHIGDSVLAIWGVQRSREDDPQSAILSALAIQEVLVSFRAERQVPLTMRVGVNTGPVLLGTVPTTGEFAVVGTAVNLTHRLEQAAPSGGVLISHTTFGHVQGVFDVIPHDPIAVEGEAERLTCYVVLRAKPQGLRVRPRGIEGIETRIVGRDAELDHLRRALVETMAGAGTRLVLITGEAGVGKSRLLYEFEKWLDLQPIDVQMFKSRAVPAMQSAPYALIRDLLANRFGILETDSTPQVLAKFRAGVAGNLEGDEADVLGHLLGFDFSTTPAVQPLLDNPSFGRLATSYLIRYVRGVGARPTAMFFEDIHWADERSLDLIRELVAALPNGQLLIACLARPQLLERHPEWAELTVEGVPDAAPAPPSLVNRGLRLRALSDSETRVLIDEILQRVERVPDSLRELVAGASEGNPFYVEEVIKRLIEDGVIVRGEPWWQVATERLRGLRVPSTLTGVLQARLDALPAAEKVVLQRASVVGRFFWDATVADLVGGEMRPDEVRARLADLCGREIIFRRQASAFVGTQEYVFKHALLHDVAYETVLHKQRRGFHALVARWLETHAHERLGEYLGLIAGHYELAGDNVRAARLLRGHCEDLRLVSAYREVIAAGERAIALLDQTEPAIRGAVLSSMGQAHRQMGDNQAAMACFEDALALAREASDTETEVVALNGSGIVCRVRGQNDRAETYLNEALAVATRDGNRHGMAHSLYNLGDLAFRRGDADAAARYATRSLAIFGQISDRAGMAYALRVLGFAAVLRADYEEAEKCHEQSQAMYDDIGDRWGVSACLINRGEVARRQGDFGKATRRYRESMAIAKETGAAYEVVICNNNLGHVLAAMGETEEARRCLCESLAGALAIGTLPVALESLVGMAILNTQAGEYESAAELVGLVVSHPCFHDETREYAEPVLAALREALPATVLDAALDRGRSMTIEEAAGAVA
jgi:class 3 adenylate cyclase/tetratricopeptide (TPR) repeat protein